MVFFGEAIRSARERSDSRRRGVGTVDAVSSAASGAAFVAEPVEENSLSFVSAAGIVSSVVSVGGAELVSSVVSVASAGAAAAEVVV